MLLVVHHRIKTLCICQIILNLRKEICIEAPIQLIKCGINYCFCLKVVNLLNYDFVSVSKYRKMNARINLSQHYVFPLVYEKIYAYLCLPSEKFVPYLGNRLVPIDEQRFVPVRSGNREENPAGRVLLELQLVALDFRQRSCFSAKALEDHVLVMAQQVPYLVRLAVLLNGVRVLEFSFGEAEEHDRAVVGEDEHLVFEAGDRFELLELVRAEEDLLPASDVEQVRLRVVEKEESEDVVLGYEGG